MQDLDTDEPLAKRIERHAFDRLIMLADGVFAIVITLSALEIRPPPGWDGTWQDYLRRMAMPLIIYALSFAITSFYWVGHRRTMARMARVDGVFTGLSLMFLALVALQPAATHFMIEVQEPGTDALLIYLGFFVLLALVQGLMWAYAAFAGGLLLAGVSPRYRWAHLASSMLTPTLACGLSLVAVYAAGPWRWLAFAGVAAVFFARRWLLTRWAETA